MSGLLARTGSAGPDEVRRPSAPDQGGELWAPDPLRSVRWSSIVSPCRSSRLRRARQTLEPPFSFRVRCPRLKSGLGVDGGAEGLAGGDDRPDYPGELVGQRHGHDLGRFAGSERGQPVAQRALALWRRPQDRDGAQHKRPQYYLDQSPFGVLDLSGRATGGAFHPTAEGHAIIANGTTEELCQRLGCGQGPGNG